MANNKQKTMDGLSGNNNPAAGIFIASNWGGGRQQRQERKRRERKRKEGSKQASKKGRKQRVLENGERGGSGEKRETEK